MLLSSLIPVKPSICELIIKITSLTPSPQNIVKTHFFRTFKKFKKLDKFIFFRKFFGKYFFPISPGRKIRLKFYKKRIRKFAKNELCKRLFQKLVLFIVNFPFHHQDY